MQVKETDKLWLLEMANRVNQGRVPLDHREMLVALRDQLPPGFAPSDVDPRLANPGGPTLLGFKSVGDPAGLLPDVERAIQFVRDQIIANTALTAISAAQLAEHLELDSKRAEWVLSLMGRLSGFSAGGEGAGSGGFLKISLNRDDVVARYLGFRSLEETLERETPPVAARQPELPAALRHVKGSVFILMNMDPNDAALIDVLAGIKGECAAFGLVASRIDEIEHSGVITDRILSEIKSSEFIVADLSGERPNVYYEVGYAHALGKRPILFRKKGTPLHFDLVVHNVPEYANVTELRAKLRTRLEAILGRAPSRGSTQS